MFSTAVLIGDTKTSKQILQIVNLEQDWSPSPPGLLAGVITEKQQETLRRKKGERRPESEHCIKLPN